MKINLDAELKAYDEKVIIPTDAEDGEALTLSTVCCNALIAVYEDEKKRLNGKESLRRHLLAQRIYPGGEQDLGVDDLVLLKKMIGKAYGPRICGPAWLLLDPPKEKEK